MAAKFRGAGGAITFLSAYAPTADSKEKENDAVYDDLAAATEEEKGSFIYIGGDFNARLYETESHQREEIGEYIIKRAFHKIQQITATDLWNF